MSCITHAHHTHAPCCRHIMPGKLLPSNSRPRLSLVYAMMLHSFIPCASSSALEGTLLTDPPPRPPTPTFLSRARALSLALSRSLARSLARSRPRTRQPTACTLLQIPLLNFHSSNHPGCSRSLQSLLPPNHLGCQRPTCAEIGASKKPHERIAHVPSGRTSFTTATQHKSSALPRVIKIAMI